MAVLHPKPEATPIGKMEQKEEEKVTRTIPNDEFKRLMEKTGAEHYGLFKKLAQ